MTATADAQQVRTRVYLVGAGPGDAGLITVKGLSLIERADVVVYDYLANPDLLAHARPEAELVYVGKKGFSAHIGQEGINDILVQKARELDERAAAQAAARTGSPEGSAVAAAPLPHAEADPSLVMGPILVRLKGGDPFVFGRGGEEALALTAAGIPFEVVPGITSGIAAPAYAGIPVTHRMVASSVTFVTGNEDPSKEETALDWDALARVGRTGGTLCFYMGVKNLSVIAERLISCGLDATTPVALVRWGTTAAQEVLSAPLNLVAERAAAAAFAAPAIIVVGPAAALREKLTWFENAPLAGRRIVVTRSRAQAGVLSDALKHAGADAVEVPTIEIGDPDSYEALDQALDNLASYTWMVFTSANGVERFFARLASKREAGIHDARALGKARVAAIGPATAARLMDFGIAADVVPDEYRAEAVFDALVAQGLTADDRVLIPRAQEAREALPDLLSAAGAQVAVAPAYRTHLPPDTRAQYVRELFARGDVDAVTFTSSSTVRNLMTLLGDEATQLLSGVDLFSIGPITSDTLRTYGFTDMLEASSYTIPGLVALVRDTYEHGEDLS